VLILAAASARILAALAAGVLNAVTFIGSPTLSNRVTWGDAFIWAGEFGDGSGLVAPAGALVLLWWQIDAAILVLSFPWSEERPPPYGEALIRLGRLRSLCTWLLLIFVASVLGAVFVTLGTVLTYSAQPGSATEHWQHYVGTSGFSLAYALLYGVGAFVSWRLRERCTVGDAELGEGEGVDGREAEER